MYFVQCHCGTKTSVFNSEVVDMECKHNFAINSLIYGLLCNGTYPEKTNDLLFVLQDVPTL